MRGRKILSLILTLTMWLGVMPSSVKAEETAVTFTALAGTAGVNDEEDYDKLLDGKKTEDDGSKWGVANFKSAYIIIRASEPVVVTGYTFTTGNDNTTAKKRNPKDWTLYACNDYDTSDTSSGSWVAIHTVTDNTDMQDVNYTPYTFTFANSSAYTYYKLLITKTQGANFMQLSEMEFICSSPEEKKYITFDKNGGDTEASPNMIEQGGGLPTTEPTRKGYEFDGWYTKNGTDGDWGEKFTAGMVLGGDATVYAKWNKLHAHCICGDEHTSVGDHTAEEFAVFEPIGTAQELLDIVNGTETEPGYYYLTADIVIPRDTNSTGWWVFAKKYIVLCLNGHKLSHVTKGDVIEVRDDFTLTDCKGTGTVTHSNRDENACGVDVNGGTFNMYGGKITENATGGLGGGVKVTNGGTFNMYGGQITENTSSSEYSGGGGVGVYEGTFNMYGGKISDNTASGYGGGVYLENANCTANILGGEISANSTSGRGGGIYCLSGDLKVENAEIKENSADDLGGGIFLSSNRIFSIKNSKVTENSAGTGGGIYSWSSGDEITDCEITENTASNEGGGISSRASALTIENSTISRNTATGNGGAVCAYTKATVKNTSISGNKAADGGGLAFWISGSDNECTLNACTIENNEATGNGGGVNIKYGVVNMTGGTIIENNTAQNGGGVYFEGDGLNMQKLNILGNTAKTGGGGVYVKNQNAVTANGGVYIYGNTLVSEGDNTEEAEGEATGAPSNLYLAKYYSSYLSHIKLTAATLETDVGSLDTKIGITLENMQAAFTDETETDYSRCFVSDDPSYAVVYKDKVLKLADAYVVTFDCGDYTEKVSVVQNTPVSEPEYEPYMDGKTFIGWFADDKEWDFSAPVTANTTISARWVDNDKADVGINSDKVYVTVPESGAVLYLVLYKNYVQTDTIRKNVEAGDTVFDMESLGIDTDSTDSVSAVLLDADDKPISQEVRVVLRIPVFDVSFNRNGGDSDADPKTLKSDEGLPATAPTKAGYTFGGWYTKNGTNKDWGEEYTSNFVVKSNLTVYARWKKNLGSVGFEVLYSTGDSGSGENASKLVDGRKTAANGTKWCVTGDFSDSGSGVYVVLKAAEDIKVTGYTLTTGNDTADHSERNPKSWKIYGCNDYNTSTKEGTWTELASVTGDTLLPAENYASAHYDITGNETKYVYYKFAVSAIGSGETMQLAELEFDYDECDHSWDLEGTVEATCFEKGYETRKCALCGEVEITVISQALGHSSDKNGNCPRCGKLAEAEVGGVKYSDFKNAVAAIENAGGTVKLLKNVEIDGGIKITHDAVITLDLNGYVLRTVNDERAIKMESGTLNIIDSRPNAVNKLDTSSTPWKPAAADESGDNIKSYSGGIITGGGVSLDSSSKGLNMSAGSFVGCRIKSYGGAIYSYGAPVVMSGNAAIRDCSANSTGHAVNIIFADFTMNDNAAIYDCGYDSSYSGYGGSAVNSRGDNVILSGNASIRKGNAKYNYGIDNSSKYTTVHANTSGTVEGDLYVKKIMSDEGCKNTTIFTGNVSAESVSAGLFYGTVNAAIENCKIVYKKSNASNAATYATNVVKSGSKAVRPKDPTDTGKKFICWKNGDAAYNFDAEVTSDITLTADWLTGEADSAEKFRQALEYKLTPIKLTGDITLDSTVEVTYPLVIDLNGYILKYESGDNAPYMFNVPENNELTLKSTNSNRTHRFDTSNSLWTQVDGSASGDKIVTMYGGIIIGSVKNDGVLNMADCIFAGCDGGEDGVVNNGGTLRLDGGSFVGCTGTVVKNSDTFMMYDGYMVSYDLSSAALVNSGNMYAKYGKIYAAVNNSGTISAGEGVGGFSVYKNVANTGTISAGMYYGGITNSANGTTAGCKLSFISDGAEYAFELLPSGSTAFMPDDPEKDDYGFVSWYKDADCTEEWDFDDDTVTADTKLYAKWISGEVSTAEELYAVADTGVGNIKLTADIEIDEAICINGTTTLDLNGHVLKFVSEDDYSDSVIYISDEDKLTIKDSNPTAEHKFDTSNALWVLAADNAEGDNIKTVYGGVITGGTGYAWSDGASYGGGIENHGTLEICGGNIIGCSANYGGGIYNGGDMTIKDVYIAGCTVSDFGNEEDSDYEYSYGGGICNSGEFEMSDGLVEYCSAEYCGGGISNRSVLIMSDGVVKNCSAKYGGGICNGGALAMVGGTVEDCAATETGGGVHNYGYFVMNALIKNNQSKIGADFCNYYYLNAVGGKIEGEVYNYYQMYCDYTDLDSLEGISCEDVTVFGGKVTNVYEIYDGMYYGGIENITAAVGENTSTGTIAAPAVTYTNGSEVYAVYVTSREDFAIVPIEPVKPGSSFEGWYNGNEKYGFNESITDNVTLTAKWSGETVSPSLAITSNEISVNCAAENATLYVSVYKNNKLVSVALKEITASGSVTLPSLGLDTSAADTIKAYLWDDNMHPICASAETSLK